MNAVAVIALIVAIVSAVGTVGAFVVAQRSIKHVRKQAELALCQIHSLRTPAWGEPEMTEGEGTSWTVAVPLVSDTPLDSVRLGVLTHTDRTAGLHLESSDEGAPGGLELGGKATWRLHVDRQGDPATQVRITSTAGSGKWSTLIDLPLRAYEWE